MKTLKECLINEANIAQMLNLTPVMYRTIETGIKKGFILFADENGKQHKFGVSKENLQNIIDVEPKNLDKVIKLLEKSGVQFKFETNKEWQDAGYEDPENFD
jgi:hypothetical protein